MSATQHNSPAKTELLEDRSDPTHRDAHLRDFVETASIGLHLVGPDGVILWANQAELDLLGYTREEYIGHPVAEFHVDEAVIDDILTRLRRGEKLCEYEARLRAKDGSVRYVLINSSVLFEDRKFVHTRCFTRDITGRKLIEEALRESEARLLEANTQLAQRMAELEKRNLEIHDSRRAALNLMEDAVRLRESTNEVNARLRESEQRLETELADMQLLQRLSADMAVEDDGPLLHEKVMDAAVQIMRSDFASMQKLHAERGADGSGGELRLLAFRGFSPEAAKYWEWVPAGSESTCGMVLRTGRRSIVPDVEQCEFMAGSADLATYLQSGIRAAQSTPLKSRTGTLIGTISTHWRKPHEPTERDWRMFDILARYAADLIERNQAATALQERAAWQAGQKKALEAALNGAQLETSLGMLVRTAVEHFGPDARAAFYLANSEGTSLHHCVGMTGDYARCIDGFEVGPESVACGLATHTGEAVLTCDVTKDPQWKDWLWLAERFDYRSCWSFPIHTSAKRFVGTLAVYWRHPREAAQRDLQLASLLTQTASVIIAQHLEAEKRERVEIALRESEIRFRMLADNMAQLAWTCDELGNVTWYNKRWLDYTGLTFEDMKGWNWSKVQHPDHLDRVVARVQRSAETGEPWEDTFPLRSKTGEYRWFLSRAVPIRDADGEIVLWFGTNTDVTDQKHAEAELESAIMREQAARGEAQAANRVKDEFLAMVSHELRTPLNAIVGWARLLRLGNLKPRDVDRAIETIDRNADAQATIINELLDISRIISGKLQIEQQPVNLVDVINAATEVNRPAAEAKGIEINLQLDGTAGPVIGDAVRLQQVVWNLLSNAIKFTPKDGRVGIELSRRDTDVVIVVSDSGQGIDAAFLPHVFERFKQADSSEKRIHGGLGLGLSIVRHFVEMHGGTIQAKSEGAAQGSTFTINLPIMPLKPLKTVLGSAEGVHASTTESDSDVYAVTSVRKATLEGVRVLVIDDQADARELFTFALEQYGAIVRVCSTANEALAEVLIWKPDVIVSDIGLPGENGYELMEKVRAMDEEQGGRTPALALTGYASAVDQAKALAAGYQTHLAKPVGIEELAEVVAKLSGQEASSQN